MISVTCAVIRNEDDEVLVVQRGKETDHPFLWEFPGGKIDEGESEEDCIIREISEELSMNIVIFGRLPDVEYDYGIKKIRLIPFICDTLTELPFLNEHIAFRWIKAEKLLSVEFSEADVFVARHYLSRLETTETRDEDRAEEHTDSDNVNDAELQLMINRMISIKEAGWIASSATENPAILNKLIEFSYSSDSKLAFHASWALSKAFDKYPGITDPFLPGIVGSLGRLENESTIRSFLRILSLTPMEKLSSKEQGVLTDFCFTTLNSGYSAIALKAYSMEILYRLSIIYSGLIPELVASINKVLEYKSAGINSKAKKILKRLDADT